MVESLIVYAGQSGDLINPLFNIQSISKHDAEYVRAPVCILIMVNTLLNLYRLDNGGMVYVYLSIQAYLIHREAHR